MSATTTAIPESAPALSGVADQSGRIQLTAEQLDAFGVELDAIRQRVIDDRGERDVAYIRRVIKAQRGLEVAGRGLLFVGFIPPAWLAASITPDSRGGPVFFSNYGSAYGYFWWLFPTRRGGNDTGVIAASGSGGQWLFVVPSLDLVVAIVASNGAGLDLMYDGVLSAIR